MFVWKLRWYSHYKRNKIIAKIKTQDKRLEGVTYEADEFSWGRWKSNDFSKYDIKQT